MDKQTDQPTNIDSQEKSTFPLWGKLACYLLVIASALHSADKSIGGGDTWVAMACGKYTLETEAIKQQEGRIWQMKCLDLFGIHTTQQEPFGAKTRAYDPSTHDIKNISRKMGIIIGSMLGKESTNHKLDPSIENIGWVNQNWLTHIIFYKMKTVFGENSIVIYKFLQAIFTALFAFWAARALGAHYVIAASTASFGVLLSRSFIDLRPNISSILFAIIMIYLLICWRNKKYWALAWMIPLTIVWSNVHGGFIYAIMIFVIMVGAHLVQNYMGKASVIVLIAALIGLGIFINTHEDPHYSQQQRDQIAKFQSEIDSGMHSKKNVETIEAWIDNQYKSLSITARTGIRITTTILIVALVIFTIIRLGNLDSESFVKIGKRGLVFMVAGLFTVSLIPAIFSPFGWENLLHPFLVATGDEGGQWRNVSEWQPIWNKAFGNRFPYVIFLSCLAVIFIYWYVLFFLKPKNINIKNNKNQKQIAWPQIDLAFFAIMAITIILSIKSRRFIFLGGIILAPFMAALLQEVIFMMNQLLSLPKDRKTSPRFELTPQWNMTTSFAILAVGIFITGTFFACMNDTYWKPAVDGKEFNVFRRMVRVQDQPVKAMEFFAENNFKGTVRCEWTQGGFVAFSQNANPENGKPGSKIYMDGRAQAAYNIDHFILWNKLNAGHSSNKKHVEKIKSTLKSHNLKYKDPKSYDILIKKMETNRENYETLIRLSYSDPLLYSKIFENEGINVIIFDLGKPQSKSAYTALSKSGRWKLAYRDTRYAVMLCIHAPENKNILRKRLVYPDKDIENFTNGLLFVSQTNNQAFLTKGFELLTNLESDEATLNVYGNIARAGNKLKQQDKLQAFFTKRYTLAKEKLDANQRFGKLLYLQELRDSSNRLASIALQQKKPEEAKKLKQRAKEHGTQLKDFKESMKENWLW